MLFDLQLTCKYIQFCKDIDINTDNIVKNENPILMIVYDIEYDMSIKHVNFVSFRNESDLRLHYLFTVSYRLKLKCICQYNFGILLALFK